MNREISIGETDKILIVLLGAIGDVTRGLSLAVRIKQHRPKCTLVWAIEPISRGLVEDHPAIDEVILFDRPKGLPAFRRFLRELRAADFDLVLDLQRHLKSGITSWSTRAKTRIGFHRRNAKEGNWLFNNHHIAPVENFSGKIHHYQKFAEAVGLPPCETLQFGLGLSEKRREEMFRRIVSKDPKHLLDTPEGDVRFAALILGSTWKSRFWFAERYVALISQLYERFGIVSILLGTKSERAFADEVMKNVSTEQVVDFIGETSLAELPALFSCAAVAVGSDSGPMHIAAAVGIPVISLWGSTSPKRSAPYGNEHLLLQSAIGCSP